MSNTCTVLSLQSLVRGEKEQWPPLLILANPQIKALSLYREPYSLAHRQWEGTSNSRSRATHRTCTYSLVKEVYGRLSLVLLGGCQGVQ